MIKVTADGTFNRVNLDIEIERLERLQADLRRLRDGGYPTTEEIRTAPRIDRWKSAGRQVTCLSGAAYGHPPSAQRPAPSAQPATALLRARGPTAGLPSSYTMYRDLSVAVSPAKHLIGVMLALSFVDECKLPTMADQVPATLQICCGDLFD